MVIIKYDNVISDSIILENIMIFFEISELFYSPIQKKNQVINTLTYVKNGVQWNYENDNILIKQESKDRLNLWIEEIYLKYL